MAIDHDRSDALHVRRFFVAGALCCLSLSVHAGAVGPVRTPNSAWDVVYNATVGAAPGVVTRSGPTFTYPSTNSAKANFPGVNSSYPVAPTSRSYTSSPGGVAVLDTVGTVVGGMVIDVVATRVVPPSAWPYIAVAGAFAGGYMAGSAIKEYFDKNDVDFDPATGEFSVIDGSTTPTDERWVANNPAIPTVPAGLKSAACQRAGQYYLNQSSSSQYITVSELTTEVKSFTTTNLLCGYKYKSIWKASGEVSWITGEVGHRNEPTGGSCVDKVGNLTPTVGGICNPGVKSPRLPGDIPPLLEKPPANPPGLVDDVVGKDIPVPGGSPQLSGPSSKPGPSSNKSGPAGNVTVNTVNNYHYEGDTITVTQTTTTTTTNPDGSVETVEETTEDVPKPTDCEKKPSMLGCSELDEVEGDEIPRDTKNITFQAEDVFDGGQCPANVQASFATIGKSATIVDWATFCGHALPLRALVIGLASIMAMFIIMPGGKVE